MIYTGITVNIHPRISLIAIPENNCQPSTASIDSKNVVVHTRLVGTRQAMLCPRVCLHLVFPVERFISHATVTPSFRAPK
jgi:hypothetical protein